MSLPSARVLIGIFRWLINLITSRWALVQCEGLSILVSISVLLSISVLVSIIISVQLSVLVPIMLDTNTDSCLIVRCYVQFNYHQEYILKFCEVLILWIYERFELGCKFTIFSSNHRIIQHYASFSTFIRYCLYASPTNYRPLPLVII